MRRLCTAALCAIPLLAVEPLAQRIAHTDPVKYTAHTSVHAGPGQMNFMALLDTTLWTPIFLLHRGVLQPKSGIGPHFHNQCEEMFVIFDGEAQVYDRWPDVFVEGTGWRTLPDGTFTRDLQRIGPTGP